ncbi:MULTISPECIES: hypothetical protein [Erysipelotrichaceae]|jgi:hypothetical protein|uniref:Uncharacterized protein n=2 Tax=Faecalibaculum rodentium TaxID=1702221 RepID=A0A140DTG9_9FIRM|nr:MULTISPECIES: hypothetical protein [Erysipelotrichaceae]AMK53946.1 hypothetical protein AALO17_08120 [Faecalibaculum rodentium]
MSKLERLKALLDEEFDMESVAADDFGEARNLAYDLAEELNVLETDEDGNEYILGRLVHYSGTAGAYWNQEAGRYKRFWTIAE